MAAITINDIHTGRFLDRKAMSSIRGGGAEWVYGWISPYVDASPNFGSIVNFYQTNNIYYADQMNNQFLNIDIKNSAPNSNITVSPEVLSINNKH